MIRTVFQGGLESLAVVLGSDYEEICSKITDTRVTILRNGDWEKGGISGSIRRGLQEIGSDETAVVFFVVDQPHLNQELIRLFLARYFETDAGILATRVADQFCHPILFKNKFFNQLMSLRGDEGGKQLFDKYPVESFISEDINLLKDIDTKKDLENFL